MDQVEEVKQKTDIVSLINEYVSLTKAGKNFKGLCPFHSEKTASFMVSPQLQTYRCFGCSEGGDAISFLQKYEGMEFYEALKFLADRAGVKLKPYKGQNISEKEKYYSANREAARFYNYILLKHPQGRMALTYLKQERGLTENTIKTFQIGFSPASSQSLYAYLTKKKGFKGEDLEKAGLTYFSRGKHWDRFNSRVVFPIFDHRGNAVAFGGRILPGDKRDVGKYINSPETLVYKKSLTLYGLWETKGEIKRSGTVVLVEGEFDFLSPWRSGIKNIAAIKGTALTQDQVKIISRYAGEIIFAFDSDQAGIKAVMKGIQMADQAGMSVKVAKLGKYKDPDEFVKADKDGFIKALSDSVPGWDYIIEVVGSKYGVESGEGKAKVSRELIPFISSITDKIVQAHYLGKIASLLGVPVEAVSDQIESYREKINTRTALVTQKDFSPEQERSEPKKGRDSREEGLISLLFEDVKNTQKRIKKVLPMIKNPLLSKIARLAAEFSLKKKFDLAAFNSSLPPELKTRFSDLVLKSEGAKYQDKLRLEREIEKQMALLKEIEKKEEIGILAKKSVTG